MRISLPTRAILVSGTALAGLLAGAAAAQVTPPAATPTGAATPAKGAGLNTRATDDGEILVTGSRIRRDPNDSPLPLQIITTQELERNAINSPEQLIAFLTTNGTGSDNLASNGDVVSGQQRGNNGASSANLRGQGSAATLVLLNGRRVAAHGLSGSAVDVNQIPFAAIERVEVLKDGASAIYGTDAIGGVINFITRKDYKGLGLSGFTDITERGDAPIYRVSGIAGYGDLDADGFNVMGSVSYSTSGALRGDQRDFVNTFQPNRGLSPDTRGTPNGTIFPLGVGPNTPRGTIISAAGTAPFVPGSTTIRASGGINVLDLPGGPGCASIEGQGPYADDLWANPSAQFACAWDTARVAAIQQPLETLTYYGRAVGRLGAHQFTAEVTGSDATAAKRFSNIQLTPNTTTQNFAYPSTGAAYTDIFNRLVAVFPTLATQRGLPIAYRWRCIECGPREIVTNTKTFRAAIGAEGPVWAGWDYRVGASYADSRSQSTLGTGYYYRDTTATTTGLINVLNSGIVNPFLLPGQVQSQAALDAIASTSAAGLVLYGGKYSVKQADGSLSGGLFRLPGGEVKAAVGVDFRREEYRFNGDTRAAATRPVVLLAPFDDGNALAGVRRDIKAAYAEILVPLFRVLEVTGAVRIDDYTGFGTTTNPKVSVKFRPFEPLMFRGSYNTGFRVPTFNQIFNGRIESVYGGNDLADPRDCPGGRLILTDPRCQALKPNLINGGTPDLGPETAKEASAGAVFQPSQHFSASVDWWMINRENTIQVLTLRQLLDNFALFPDRFIRDAAGNLTAIDQTWINAGATRTQGLEVAVRGGFDLRGGTLTAGIDGTYLLKKREKILESAPFGPSLIGVFTPSGDLGLRWKHNAFIGWSDEAFSITFTQLFRNGYDNQVLPGVLSGAVTPPDVVRRVDDYVIYNLSAGYRINEQFRLTAGVRNLFDRDPPFAISYDANTGGGSSWEPRVADPRGRSFTLLAEVKF